MTPDNQETIRAMKQENERLKKDQQSLVNALERIVKEYDSTNAVSGMSITVASVLISRIERAEMGTE